MSGAKILEFPRRDSWDLVVEFDTDDPEFTRGFEAGRIYAALDANEEAVREFQVHKSNADMMERIATATSHVIDSLGERDGWITLRFIRRGLPPA